MLDSNDLVQTFTQEREAIETRFQNLFDSTTCPVQYGNLDYRVTDTGSTSKPSKTDRFVQLEVIGGAVSTNEITRTITNVSGIINVNIFTAKGTGTRPALEIADQVFEIFNMAVFNGINCAWASRTVVPPNNGWYQLNISIPYSWQRCIG